jgi:hypothetical protein
MIASPGLALSEGSASEALAAATEDAALCIIAMGERPAGRFVDPGGDGGV